MSLVLFYLAELKETLLQICCVLLAYLHNLSSLAKSCQIVIYNRGAALMLASILVCYSNLARQAAKSPCPR